MNQNLLALLTLVSPLGFLITALASVKQPGIRPTGIKRASTASAIASILISAICGFFVFSHGLLESHTLGIGGWGFSLRLDPLSMTMLGMISILSLVVVRFSLNYLDGDARQGLFLGRLALTIASVQILVLAGNLVMLFLAWVLTSMALHRLLVFYRERPGAIAAARKKFIVARLGDLCLLGALILAYHTFDSGNLEMVFTNVAGLRAGNQAMLEGMGVLLVVAAMLKSAQFPTQGWLIEVMETPTPVSALLHAGLLNAGPFLVIRMSRVLEVTTTSSLLLLLVGGLTALFASLVYLTQTSVKTALGYSSAAHMGFSLMVCGLGVYPAAMLHMVAHSFYKAHAFLSSGSVIDVLRAAKVKGGVPSGSALRVFLGVIGGFLLYGAYALLWGLNPEEDLQLMVIGAIISLGLGRLFATALDFRAGLPLLVRTTLLCLTVATSFFVLESIAHTVLESQLPDTAPASGVEVVIMGILLAGFAAVVWLQIMAPVFMRRPDFNHFAIHLKNAFYTNAVFDRMVGALYTEERETSSEPIPLWGNGKRDRGAGSGRMERQPESANIG